MRQAILSPFLNEERKKGLEGLKNFPEIRK